MRRPLLFALLALPAAFACAADAALSAAIARDYDATLAPLFEHLHRNPELSFLEVKTAARLASELRAAGFEVSEGVGKTGVVAIMKNGAGPMVLVRADMDGLPVLEKSGLPYASTVIQKDQSGREVPVAHSCGHDIHMTSLVGTARQMAARKSQWQGTLMLVGQPAEERVGGAALMVKDALWKRFGRPDYALALHVASHLATGKINIDEAPFSGVDSLEINIPGLGTHGASPHLGKDPVVLGAQIVLALQTIVSRELGPREAGLITVGSFHSGTKGNIISDMAKLELTVRSESPETRALLLGAIKRVALNTACAAGMPEHLLPTIKLTDDPSPPVLNDHQLSERLRAAWSAKLGPNVIDDSFRRTGMGAEDFGYFTREPYVPSVYFRVGGTSAADLAAEKKGGPAVSTNHSPLFKAVPDASIKTGVETTVVALFELMKK
jgi:amidohydrolase